MDTTQDNASQLSGRVDALYTLLEQINEKVSSLTNLQGMLEASQGHQFGVSPPNHVRLPRGLDQFSGHKDILLDEPNWDPEHTGQGQPLSQEIQIQRLTAQLTAAYNRIAALEEQLLSHRVH
jgi:hypothetical protein